MPIKEEGKSPKLDGRPRHERSRGILIPRYQRDTGGLGTHQLTSIELECGEGCLMLVYPDAHRAHLLHKAEIKTVKVRAITSHVDRPII